MANHCVLRGGKHRVVEDDGTTTKDKDGHPVDGGGHDTKEACEAQSRAINSSQNNTQNSNDPNADTWRPGEFNQLVRFKQHGDVEIDKDAGILFGVSILTMGEAKGHGQFVDETMLDQAVKFGKEKEPLGLKSRFDHPNACSRSFGAFTGRFHNFRRDGKQARADLHLSDASAKSPDGNLRDYILELAAEDPAAFATSIVFKNAIPFEPDRDSEENKHLSDDDPFFLPHARIAALSHCDVVDEGAANESIFGRPDYMAEQIEKWADENDGLIARVLTKHINNKKKKEVEQMSDRTLTELQDELSAMADRADKAELALKESDEKLTVALDDNTTNAAAKYDEGLKAGIERMKERLEKYSVNTDLVLETALDDDSVFKDKMLDAVTNQLSKKNKDGSDDGADGADFSESDDGSASTFEAEVDKKVDNGTTRKVALSECTAEFPKLHKTYIARMTKSRKD